MSSQLRAGRIVRSAARSPRLTRSSWRLGCSAALGLVAGILAAGFGGGAYAPAIGWDVAAMAFCLWIWLPMWPADAALTAMKAKSEDPNRAVSDVIALTACVASIAAVGTIMVAAHTASGVPADVLAALGLVTVAVSWFTVHTIFALKYAVLYHAVPAGGVDFHQEEPPRFADFAYLSLGVGCTFQVSDTDLQTTQFRSAVLRHSLLSYLFGAVILAVLINLIASL
jgi:uncharacterized membrane protein